MLTRIPARSKSKDGYIKEFEAIGFKVESFDVENTPDGAPALATIKVRK